MSNINLRAGGRYIAAYPFAAEGQDRIGVVTLKEHDTRDDTFLGDDGFWYWPDGRAHAVTLDTAVILGSAGDVRPADLKWLLHEFA